jgi:hypothetical protein
MLPGAKTRLVSLNYHEQPHDSALNFLLVLINACLDGSDDDSPRWKSRGLAHIVHGANVIFQNQNSRCVCEREQNTSTDVADRPHFVAVDG